MTDDLKRFHVPSAWSLHRDKLWAAIAACLWLSAMVVNDERRDAHRKQARSSAIIAGCMNGGTIVWKDPLTGKDMAAFCDKQIISEGKWKISTRN